MNTAQALKTTIRITATPAEVFPYFVEPALLLQWIGDSADLNAEPGGVFALDMTSVAIRGTYLELEPPNRVVFTWGIPGNEALPEGSSTVEVTLVADGDETIVELVHRDLPTDQRAAHETGWTAQLDRLRGIAGA